MRVEEAEMVVATGACAGLDVQRREPEAKRGERSWWDCEESERGQQGKGHGLSWQGEGRGQPWLRSTRGTKQVPCVVLKPIQSKGVCTL